MSGVIVERRDQVLMTGGRCPPARAFSTAFTMPLSMNGPFLTERAIGLQLHPPITQIIHSVQSVNGFALLSPAILQDHLLRALVAARLVTTRRLAPRRHRISSTGGL